MVSMIGFCGYFRSPVRFDASFAYLEKRSPALRGRNLTRDTQVDGAPTVHPVPVSQGRQGPLFWHLRTPEFMPQKSWGSGGNAPSYFPLPLSLFHDLLPEPGFRRVRARLRCRLASLSR